MPTFLHLHKLSSTKVVPLRKTRDEFKESAHPRDSTGEFTAGASSGSVAKSKPAPSWSKHGGGTFAPHEVSRLQALKVPPAWTDVKLSPDPQAALQVVGRDAKGRAQYRYSTQHAEKAAAEKFGRLKAFNAVADKVVSAADKDMFDPKLPPKQRDAAAVVRLIAATGFRIGGETDTKADAQAYGASTLTKEHVKLGKGGAIDFEFVGKKGVKITKSIRDPGLHKFVQGKLDAGADKLFESPGQSVRDYLKAQAGDEFKVKDFRTWHGTNEALRAIETMPVPQGPKEFEKARLEVARRVSAHLGNTPTIALSAYIDPAVFSKWSAKQ